MTKISSYRLAVPLALAAAVGLFTAASAQQQSPPAKQAKPATKSEPKSEPKGEAKSPQPKQTKQAAPGPAAGGAQPTLLGQFGDWGAYTASNAGKKLCYALAKPSSSATEPNRPRDPAYVFISTRPSENVRNEISIVMGYPFKPGADATVDIGSAKYAMYTQADGAWIKNAAEEARMVDTMRKGSDMVVAGESGRGTKSTDRYALKGLSQALDRVAQECK
jgi:invasion protein IalB